MLKNFSKLLFLLLIVSIMGSISICYATEAVTTSETSKTENTTSSTTSETAVAEDANYYGDLYISDKDVVIDNVIYGNVYIIGNNVEITGQIEGNLFVIAKNLKLDKSYIGGSIYAYANDIYYNNASTYLYAIADNIEMTYDSFVVRDARIKADTSTIKAAIGRDLYLESYNINLGENEQVPIIYGNFEYTSPSELSIPKEVLTEKSSVSYSYKMPLYLKTIIVITIILLIATLIAELVIQLKKKENSNKYTEKIPKKDNINTDL